MRMRDVTPKSTMQMIVQSLIYALGIILIIAFIYEVWRKKII